MKHLPLLGVVGLALCVACGGEGDGGDGDGADATTSNVSKSGQDDGTGDKTGQEDGTGDKTGQPDGVDERPVIHGKVGQPDGVGERGAPYEYVLHGSDADIEAWLSDGDVITERSPAGQLTLAVVRSAKLRAIPANLQP